MTAISPDGHGFDHIRAPRESDFLRTKPAEAHAVVRDRLTGFLQTVCRKELSFHRAEDMELVAHFVENLVLSSKDLLWLESIFLVGSFDTETQTGIRKIAQWPLLEKLFFTHQRAVAAEEGRATAEAVANTDPLTGLNNRRGLESALERLGSKLGAVLMIDIDHFKSINDRHGHDAGDKALHYLAEVCRTQLRDSAQVARWGGEEFLVVLPDVADEVTAKAIAERLRVAIHADSQERLGFEMTASLGVALGVLSQFDALKNQADERLYAAKHGGRNRVVTGQEEAA